MQKLMFEEPTNVDKFGMINGLNKYKRGEDDRYVWWGDLDKNYFEISVNKESLNESDIFLGAVYLNIFGATHECTIRAFAKMPKLTEVYSDSVAPELRIYENRFQNVCPPEEILEMMHMDECKIDYSLSTDGLNYLSLYFDTSDSAGLAKLRIFDTFNCGKQLEAALDMARGLRNICCVPKERNR